MTNATELRYYRNMGNEEKILSTIKEHHLRLTKTRRAILEMFFHQHAPLSVLRILEVLEKNGITVNKTTVYRELETLEKIGIVQTLSFQDRRQYFELATRSHHHHLICLQCEQIEDVDVSEAELLREERKVSREKRFVVLRHSLEFFGLCQHCQSVEVK